jgi:hypothetical protein
LALPLRFRACQDTKKAFSGASPSVRFHAVEAFTLYSEVRYPPYVNVQTFKSHPVMRLW